MKKHANINMKSYNNIKIVYKIYFCDIIRVLKKGDVFMSIDKIIINNIKEYIEENKIKQTWIADMTDMNPMTLSNILNFKKVKNSLEELKKITDVLDLNILDLAKETFINSSEKLLVNKKQSEIVYCRGDIQEDNMKNVMNTFQDIMIVMDTIKEANKENVFD